MSLQHQVTGPAAQVPDPDRVIHRPGGQATVRQHDQGAHILQYRGARDYIIVVIITYIKHMKYQAPNNSMYILTRFVCNDGYKLISHHHLLVHKVYIHQPLIPLYAPSAPGHRLRCPGSRPGSSYHMTRRPGDRQAARPGRSLPTT